MGRSEDGYARKCECAFHSIQCRMLSSLDSSLRLRRTPASNLALYLLGQLVLVGIHKEESKYQDSLVQGSLSSSLQYCSPEFTAGSNSTLGSYYKGESVHQELAEGGREAGHYWAVMDG